MYMAPAYEYVEYAEYAEISSETRDTDDDENLNTWNALPPAQRYNRACRIGRCAGWLCRAILRWTFCTCPWNGKQVSDCRDAQIELCGRASTCLNAWKARERLLHAQPHCAYGTIRNGSMAVRQEVRRLGQSWTKGQTGSKCAQERMTASTAEKPKRRVARACAYTYQCVEHRGTTTVYPASLRAWYNTEWECGSEARVTEALSALDKYRTGSKRTQDGITVLLEFCMSLGR